MSAKKTTKKPKKSDEQPAAADAPQTEAPEPPGEKKKQPENLRTYIHRLLKSVDKDVSIRSQAIVALDSMAHGLIVRLTDAAVSGVRLSSAPKSKVKTASLRSVQAATYAVLPGSLREALMANAQAAVELSKANAGEKKKSRAAKADLILSISRVNNAIKARTNEIRWRVGGYVAVYIASIVEQVLRLVFPKAVEAARALQRESINEQALLDAVQASPYLMAVLSDWYLVAKEAQDAKKAEKKAEKKEKSKKAGKADAPKKEEKKSEEA